MDGAGFSLVSRVRKGYDDVVSHDGVLWCHHRRPCFEEVAVPYVGESCPLQAREVLHITKMPKLVNDDFVELSCRDEGGGQRDISQMYIYHFQPFERGRSSGP